MSPWEHVQQHSPPQRPTLLAALQAQVMGNSLWCPADGCPGHYVCSVLLSVAFAHHWTPLRA